MSRARVAFWVLLVAVPLFLVAADALSRRPSSSPVGLRIITTNVDTHPVAVAEAIRRFSPDLVFMQETGGACAEAGRVLGLLARDGSDQCVLSRWLTADQPVQWPGPWQPPQALWVTPPGLARLLLVNARLALPHSLARLAGHNWYTAAQRRDQFGALRQIVSSAKPVILCGDLNALPLEVTLGPGFSDLWRRFTYGATFPGSLPAARIDQCWATPGVAVLASWTAVVPSDHRAVVFSIAPPSGSDR